MKNAKEKNIKEKNNLRKSYEDLKRQNNGELSSILVNSDATKILNNKESTEKTTEICFKNLKKGDKIYGIELPYVKNSKGSKVEGTIEEVKIGHDTNEYYGGSSVGFEINGEKKEIYLWESELPKAFIRIGRSTYFLSKEERDIYYKEQTPNDIESINTDFRIGEEGNKKLIEKEKRWAKKEFISLEDELEYIDDIYDHEGPADWKKKNDEERDKAIKAAKGKWKNK